MKNASVLIVIGLLLATSVAIATVPNLMSLQGLLRDGAGDPVADGNYVVAFTTYDAAFGGSVLWAETTLVSTTNGLFNVLLGSTHPVPDSLFNDPSRYLGIKVDADPEMTPRQRLSSVGYSFVSSQWNSVGTDAYRDTGHVGIGVPTPLAELHVREMDMGLDTLALLNENIIVEDDDAVIGLYSGTGGTFGSALVLGEIDAGVYTNKWGMYRTKTTNGSRLGFSYGADANYGLNPAVMSLDGPNSRMGVGTIAPQNRLDVEGAAVIGNAYSGTETAPSNGLLVEGNVGVGVPAPLAGLHVRGDFPLGLVASPALTNENIIIEDDDAVLGLYSSTGGTYGSAIALGEIDAGVYTNKWSIFRTKTTSGALMGFSYGTDTSYSGNPWRLTLDGPNGRMCVGGVVPLNRLDVHGAAVIGTAYSGAETAPSNGLLVEGNVGVGVPAPLAGLHVRGDFPLGLVASPALTNENIIIEDDDAVLGLYSSTGGTYGSAIALGEIDAGVYTNKWSIFRTKTTSGALMGFSYGTDTSYAGNPWRLTLDGPNGRMCVGGVVPLNRLDVHGAAVIGSAYSGAITAPSNGLLVQGKMGLASDTVFSDANTNLTMSGSIGFNTGTTPMMYIFEGGSTNSDRPIISHSPSSPNYGIKYDDVDDAVIFQGNGNTRMSVDLVVSGNNVLDVNGNVTVGTGTTGCVRDADGTIIAGTCSSDERFKTEIEPFAEVLDKLVQLEPVHFRWRSDEFPDRKFGTSQSYGLIAQDAEKVMPDLVTEDEEGYMAVRYSKLPLLLLEAVKEQQAQIELLKAEIAQLRNPSGDARAEK